MNRPQLIVTDLDGTALRDNKTISGRTIDAFHACQRAGIPIAIATARYIAGAMPYARILRPNYLILTDGTLVYRFEPDTEQLTLIYSNTMAPTVVNQILEDLLYYKQTTHIAIPTETGLFRFPEGLHCNPENDHEKNGFSINSSGNTQGYFFEPTLPFPYPANKIVAQITDSAIAEKIAQNADCGQFHYHNEDRYTFFHKTAGKLDAISYIAQHLSTSLEHILAFGDDINDISMIAHCGMGVAMGNALPEVKQAAAFVTSSNEDDGIASFINQRLHLEIN